MKKILYVGVILIYIVLTFVIKAIGNVDCQMIHGTQHYIASSLKELSIISISIILLAWLSTNISRKVDFTKNRFFVPLYIIAVILAYVFYGLGRISKYGINVWEIVFIICTLIATIAIAINRKNKKIFGTSKKIVCTILTIVPVSIIILAATIYNSIWNEH